MTPQEKATYEELAKLISKKEKTDYSWLDKPAPGVEEKRLQDPSTDYSWMDKFEFDAQEKAMLKRYYLKVKRDYQNKNYTEEQYRNVAINFFLDYEINQDARILGWVKKSKDYIYLEDDGQWADGSEALFNSSKFTKYFTPVILSAGLNTRWLSDEDRELDTKVSKPLQTITGCHLVVTLLSQLIKSGFKPNDIYVVTRFGTDYYAEPFWFFYDGSGRNLGINNITFSEPLDRADEIKRFADGDLEEVRYGNNARSWYFVEKRPELKKNLLVMHADNTFINFYPIMLFADNAAEFLSKESHGYCISEMLQCSDITVEPKPEIAMYAFDRKAYSEVVIPRVPAGEKPVSISNFVCKEMDKNGKLGMRIKSRCKFWNMNDQGIYNSALRFRSRSYKGGNRVVDGTVTEEEFKKMEKEASKKREVYPGIIEIWP